MSAYSVHSMRVMKLYRHSLKNLQNWAVHRDLFIERGFAMRAEFDANKFVKDPRLVEKIVSDGEAKLAEFRHPDPYTRESPDALPRAAAAPARSSRPLLSRGRHALPHHALVTLVVARALPSPCPQCRTCPAAPSTSGIRRTAWARARRSPGSRAGLSESGTVRGSDGGTGKRRPSGVAIEVDTLRRGAPCLRGDGPRSPSAAGAVLREARRA